MEDGKCVSMGMGAGVCPGCHRHCDLSKPSCGYGRKYADKNLKAKAPEKKVGGHAVAAFSADEKLAKDLIHTGKALKRAEKPRGERLGTLSGDEKAALEAILHKIAGGVGINLDKAPKLDKRRE